MKDLQARQQTLINLITRVGGRQNIQKWMDELLKIDVQLEKAGDKKVVYEFKVLFSQGDYVITPEQLDKLAQIWQGTVTKQGDILTNIYPEDVCDKDDFQLYKADGWEEGKWEEGKPTDYSQVEKLEIPVPTQEQYLSDVLAGKAGEKARQGLLNEQATWEMVEFIPAHREYKEQWSHPSNSKDGYRSTSASTVKRYQAEIPDTWVWVSSTGMKRELPTATHKPSFKTDYSYEWYCDWVKTQYLKAYQARKEAWLVGKTVDQVKQDKLDKEKAEIAAKEAEIEARNAAKLAKLQEAESKIDSVWEQLLIDCPKAAKKGLSDRAEYNKVTKPSDIAAGYIAKLGDKLFKTPESFEEEFLKYIFEKETTAKKAAVLEKHGLKIDGWHIVRCDGKNVNIKTQYINRYGKNVRKYGTDGVLIENFHHITESDGVTFPPMKSFEKWLVAI